MFRRIVQWLKILRNGDASMKQGSWQASKQASKLHLFGNADWVGLW